MKTLITFLLIADLCVLEVTASWGVFFMPNAPIASFKSTIIVPAAPPDVSINGIVQAVWPGLQNEAANVVLQNVVNNQGSGPHTWWFMPFYCCNPTEALSSSTQDVFELSQFTNIWNDQWSISPGSTDQAAQEQASNEQVLWNPANFGNPTAFDTVLFAVELQQQGTWDFGPVAFTNIQIIAQTTDTAWCTNGPLPNPNFKFTFSTPSVQLFGSYSICSLDSITLQGPS